MTVTHEAVGEVIEHIFTTSPSVSSDFVRFGLEHCGLLTEVTISVYEDVFTYGQVMDMFFWLVDSTGHRLNMRTPGWSKALELCKQLQDAIDWCTLSPYQFDGEEDIQIALSRRIDVSESDLRMAMNRDIDSEFLRIFERLSEEWELVSPILLGVATGQINPDNQLLKHLLQPSAGNS